MGTHQYAELGFDAPTDWLDVSVMTFARPTDAGYAPTVELTRQTAPAGRSIDAFAKKHLKTIRRTLKKYRLVDERPTEVAGEDAYRVEHRFQSPERVDVHQLQYIFRTGADVAILCLTCAVGEIDDHRNVFESIAQSVRREPHDH